MSSQMDYEGNCLVCHDYARDCQCEECAGCGKLMRTVHAEGFTDDGMPICGECA